MSKLRNHEDPHISAELAELESLDPMLRAGRLSLDGLEKAIKHMERTGAFSPNDVHLLRDKIENLTIKWVGSRLRKLNCDGQSRTSAVSET